MAATPESIKVEPVAWLHPDAQAMRAQLSEELGARYLDRESIPNHLPREFFVDEVSVLFVAIARVQGLSIGHIALRRLGEEVELKNMYVARPLRGAGVAMRLLEAAETFAERRDVPRIILQTGDRQPEAVRFYLRMGYQRIPIYEPYQNLSYSNCFEKRFSN
ncbi:GNAT family N-acetyltransferase [Bradyrhizobium liaoningense]|uniref:GNAT family N-acetyltransferase n=1 Tax=Bradyrhizobium liaoningense TaxID=43992 RepID=UPI001BA6B428|nr:GNAT family N-acetyltransferase [Bradyrhizobium liaoningense]MBR0844152.1 GNAT family N-acetyltransferase [Bradyrhizobium liaoningense]MBR0859756.1 GNAT family N-acetyltransferase [Bradyrhizobium liaoningense]